MVRASAAAPSFDADAADVATVAQICRRLDGLPLAIELAAARLRALSLEQIATRLDDRFRLLRAGERTLEAVVAWSYDLLTDAEREVFVRLAVFPADFSLEAAEMVVSDAVVEERDVLDLLTRLVEKSLVTTVISDDTYRYRLLETLREYALARLDERGEVDRWNDRLLEWAMTRVEYVEASLRRPAQDAALQSVSADAVTLRAAMNWATPEATSSPHCGSPRRYPIGLVGERRQIITSLLERLGSASRTVVRRPRLLGAREPGVRAGRLGGIIRIARGRCRALPARGVRTGRRVGRRTSASTPAWGTGDLAKADALVRQAIDGFRSDGDTMGLGYALSDAALLDDGSRRGPATGRRRPTSSCERPARRSESPTTSKDAGSSPTTGMSSLTRPRSSPKPSRSTAASAISGAALTPWSRRR